MIYAYSVLTGYVTMRGSMFVHLPMFIAMMAFLSPIWKKPGEEGYQLPLPEEMEWQAASASFWIVYGTWIHFILATLHFLSFTQIPPRYVTYRLIAQILGVLAQVFNFTVAGYLYAGAPAYELL